ncbi:MAG TPA: flagellar hook-basal body complex protein [bacterium]|nr:flagellar hook-basal body complex protein [bacterium]
MSLEGLYSALSGLRNDSLWLDVIGNNISNVSTVGYKSSRAEFLNSFGQTLSAGSADNPAEGLGGTNPAQVGLGSGLAQIDTLFSQGNIQTTGQNLDVAIQGNGFLEAKQGSQTYLTRAGDLSLDSNGNLVDDKGGLIQGFNASIQYTKEIINSFSSVPGQPAVVTHANLTLNNQNPANVSNININPSMTIPPKATTQVNFAGNLDSFQQANQPGGILDLNPGGNPILPLSVGIDLFGFNMNNAKVQLAPLPNGGYALQQVGDLTQNTAADPYGVEYLGIDLNQAQASAGTYAWEQQPPVEPATQASETTYDSLGNPHEITVLFYQVNDLGAAGINNNTAAGQSQVCYAWYAFDTTGGKAPASSNLLGGTGISEGAFTPPLVNTSYDRGLNGLYIGDFIYFNTDGSLANTGGVSGIKPALLPQPDMPRIYIPATNALGVVSPRPVQGAEIMAVNLNFGTAGVLGQGKRDGLFSDAEGSYQVVNGVNTYVPQFTAHAVSQDGYADGTLQSLSVDRTGTLQGAFSNGQTLALAQLSMARVNNPEGLESVGNGYYQASASSGTMEQTVAGKEGLGTIQGGALENSNVDLTVELSNMIIAQRGYEANAREVAVINSTLGTLATLGEMSAA